MSDLKCNICNDCIYSKCDVIFTSDGLGYKNFYCCHKGTKNVIDVSVKYNSEVKTPKWCPLLGDENKPLAEPEKETKTEMKNDTYKWYQITPSVNWDDIKKKDIYHIPPHLNQLRKDIEVVYKCDEYFTYKNVNGCGDYLLCYKESLMARLIVKKI